MSETQIFESDQNIEDVSNFIDYNDDCTQDFIISTTDSIIVIVNKSGSYNRAISTIKPNTPYSTNLELFDFNNDGEIVLICSFGRINCYG